MKKQPDLEPRNPLSFGWHTFCNLQQQTSSKYFKAPNILQNYNIQGTVKKLSSNPDIKNISSQACRHSQNQNSFATPELETIFALLFPEQFIHLKHNRLGNIFYLDDKFIRWWQ